jgi:hypothetical protein
MSSSSKLRTKGRIPGIRREPLSSPDRCVECRLHWARLDEEQRARYDPPLGVKFRIRLKSGGTIDLCPRCAKVGKETLLERGIRTQREASRATIDV